MCHEDRYYRKRYVGLSGIAMSLPHLLGGEGVLRTIPIRLDGKIKQALNRCAEVIRDAVRR